jgi:hypothetical protein
MVVTSPIIRFLGVEWWLRFVMYTIDRLLLFIFNRKAIYIILMQRLGLPHFKKKCVGTTKVR